ncbi:FAD-dependent monooxygenase [Puniceibacterium sp. IMCC21224]|uniref:FAD-dependent monooxygenase n=1 Tax=Puniceibacterium sp. IMCC21224 TaxID=1618204 RepID=UPI00064DBEF2|nr:FAD-dependent monooxygenase [Puniceibacterium sp. IMCC21224]KMK66868.1 2-polyprenyl-6-methoxyphenol hydroxylase-like oxidoreductase [Puniceibacterium sp. IMCC21224]
MARNVTVIGGGIGGLAAALCLRRRGYDVRVLEQADALREVGAGLQISPNGLCVLRALGLEGALEAVSVRAQAVELRDYAQGARVLRLDLARAAQGYHLVHRADLLDLLVAAARAAGIEILLGQRVREVVPGPVPLLRMESGDLAGGDLVVGADGFGSVLRPVLNSEPTPAFSGQVAWRALVPNTLAHGAEARVYMGPGRHLVSYPLRGGTLVNLVAVEERSDWAAEGWNHVDDADALRRAFAGFGGEVPALLQMVEAPRLWGLVRHPPAQVWWGDGVALLGDAAHPMLPFLAQGANMALEDAWVLADCLAQNWGPAGLAAYQAARRPRVARVVAAAAGNTWKYHLRNPLLRHGAHLGLRVAGRVAPGHMMRQFDWLYGVDVTAGV